MAGELVFSCGGYTSSCLSLLSLNIAFFKLLRLTGFLERLKKFSGSATRAASFSDKQRYLLLWTAKGKRDLGAGVLEGVLVGADLPEGLIIEKIETSEGFGVGAAFLTRLSGFAVADWADRDFPFSLVETTIILLGCDCCLNSEEGGGRAEDAVGVDGAGPPREG